MTIRNCDFDIYGTILNAFSILSFYSENVKITTDRMVGGYVFVIRCDPTIDETSGEVIIDNLRMDGGRSIFFKYGGVYLAGPQNFTVKNSYIGSYGYMFDAKQLTRSDSPLNCLPDDGLSQ